MPACLSRPGDARMSRALAMRGCLSAHTGRALPALPHRAFSAPPTGEELFSGREVLLHDPSCLNLAVRSRGRGLFSRPNLTVKSRGKGLGSLASTLL
ncbi:hypothetical protein VNO80_01298 [Phaseolus coccineus]|uniref:Uncharacterized protein n=1 Tax=Phaseolus coccineus TaxID=3886 RepID=A0AAN9RSM3_PHACN